MSTSNSFNYYIKNRLEYLQASKVSYESSALDVLQADVCEFMQKAGQDQPDEPSKTTESVELLRLDLIAEELHELEFALGYTTINDNKYKVRECDMVETYDALLDLLVVVIGTANALGLCLQPGWDEVHRSNMSKFIDGHRREDGKWMKGPSYSPAELKPIIEELSK
jgi:predicted HAD superfamily Cof-like phosphohydrolase